MIDNYDSFTYNLVHYLEELGAPVEVHLNDKITLAKIAKMRPATIILSPGPKTPNEGGICLDAIEKFAGKVPILGICLGHQAIGQVFGARVIRAPALMHGRLSDIHHDGKGLFQGLPSPYRATRYHSLTLDPGTFPGCLEVTAKTEDGVIMGLKHKDLPLWGVQFHPESLLTEHGHALLQNFLKSAKVPAKGGHHS